MKDDLDYLKQEIDDRVAFFRDNCTNKVSSDMPLHEKIEALGYKSLNNADPEKYSFQDPIDSSDAQKLDDAVRFFESVRDTAIPLDILTQVITKLALDGPWAALTLFSTQVDKLTQDRHGETLTDADKTSITGLFITDLEGKPLFTHPLSENPYTIAVPHILKAISKNN